MRLTRGSSAIGHIGEIGAVALACRMALARNLQSASPLSSIGRRERDFARRRLTRRKRLRDDISAQRPEIGDHHTREMAAKAAFVLAGLNI
jgi:hypothetical protein